MPFVTAKSQQRIYDVIVVGSGAAGGQSAYTLCMDGAKVLMLEAGRKYTPETETGHTAEAFRFLRRDGGWRLGGARGALHARRQGRSGALRMVARAHARRPHESLGKNFAAQRAV